MAVKQKQKKSMKRASRRAEATIAYVAGGCWRELIGRSLYSEAQP